MSFSDKANVGVVGSSNRRLIASADIQSGTVIAQASTVRLCPDIVLAIRSTTLFEYCFVDPQEYETTHSKAAYIAFDVMSFCNHHESPNAKVEWLRHEDPPDLQLTAIRDIRQGEEITIRYTNWEQYHDHVHEPTDEPEYRRIVVDGQHYYGKHLLLTARGCDENILSTEAIGVFLSDLAPQISMIAFGEPIVTRFGSGIEIGVSGVQLIETSLISMHTNDAARDMYLDVFSCKGFREDLVRAAVLASFAPAEVEMQVLLRR